MARRGAAKRRATRKRARDAGFRSAFEQRLATEAGEAGLEYEYEAIVIRYQGKPKRYTPDFKLPNGIIVEAKGRFTSADRAKHLLIKEQHPELDIRFVFQYDNTLDRRTSTRYSEWAEQHGFQYAIGSIPEEWWDE